MSERHCYNMGVIGNCAYMAYVGLDSDIKWMCWPRFDSSSVFGGLLDEQRGGHFSILPCEGVYTSKQYYITNTNVLCTEFDCPDGKYRVMDFAPRFYQYERNFKPLMLVRIIEPLEGHPRVTMRCNPVGDYGKTVPEPYLGSNHIRYLGLDRPLRLTSDYPLNYILDEQPIVLDSTKHAILTYGIPLEGPLESTAKTFYEKTVKYWQEWVESAFIPHWYQEAVIRSGLVLKLHQYEDTGAIIAAGTTSLPEYPGEGRNWDYRFCWMRDSYYTLRALNNLGHFEELRKYSNFIQNVASINAEPNNPLYPISGDQSTLEERILKLEGYQGNQPVRIGNQAHEHVQNDVYGQILTSLLPLYTDARFVQKDRDLALRNTRLILDKIEQTIDDPDAGLWEFRNKEQKHCYTFLFHWAGAHAGCKIGKFLDDEKIVTQAEKLIKRAAENIEACYDEEAGVYRQAIGSKNLDASLFQLITMGYLDPHSARAKRHLDKLEEELKQGEWLFFRYKHADDFGTPKSTFLVCAFWYIEALAAVGRLTEARKGLEQLISYGNHLGLFSEDIEASTGSQWGNFPQTYSHVGMMNAAYMINNKANLPDYLVY